MKDVKKSIAGAAPYQVKAVNLVKATLRALKTHNPDGWEREMATSGLRDGCIQMLEAGGLRPDEVFPVLLNDEGNEGTSNVNTPSLIPLFGSEAVASSAFEPPRATEDPRALEILEVRQSVITC